MIWIHYHYHYYYFITIIIRSIMQVNKNCLMDNNNNKFVVHFNWLLNDDDDDNDTYSFVGKLHNMRSSLSFPLEAKFHKREFHHFSCWRQKERKGKEKIEANICSFMLHENDDVSLCVRIMSRHIKMK